MILQNFAVFEGIDGTGTTTQLSMLSRRFSELRAQDSESVYFTCEPTGNDIGTLIRKALSGAVSYHPETVARLFAADRAEHLYGSGGIIERIHNGQAVFSDRYFFSSLAYQGEAAGQELAKELNFRFPLPEYVFYFDIDPVLSMDRVERRAGAKEIYEKLEFQRLVRSRYLHIMETLESENKDVRIVRIDASRPIQEISDYIWSISKNLPKM